MTVKAGSFVTVLPGADGQRVALPITPRPKSGDYVVLARDAQGHAKAVGLAPINIEHAKGVLVCCADGSLAGLGAREETTPLSYSIRAAYGQAVVRGCGCVDPGPWVWPEGDWGGLSFTPQIFELFNGHINPALAFSIRQTRAAIIQLTNVDDVVEKATFSFAERNQYVVWKYFGDPEKVFYTAPTCQEASFQVRAYCSPPEENFAFLATHGTIVGTVTCPAGAYVFDGEGGDTVVLDVGKHKWFAVLPVATWPSGLCAYSDYYVGQAVGYEFSAAFEGYSV